MKGNQYFYYHQLHYVHLKMSVLRMETLEGASQEDCLRLESPTFLKSECEKAETRALEAVDA